MAGQAIQITINVTDGNASEAVQKVVAQLQAIGPAGEAAGAGAGAGLDQVGEHALSARENVKLLNDDLGLHIPRAMQAVIGQSEMLSGAIRMIGPGLIAMGAVDIFAHMAESAYNLYEKYIDIGAAQREFLKNMDEAKDKDFVNVHSLETAQLRIGQVTASIAGLNGAAQDMSKQGWGDLLGGVFDSNAMGASAGLAELLGARRLAGAGAKAEGQSQELSPAEQALLHQQNMAQIEADHAGDSELKGQSKITAELQKQLEIDKEKQHYTMIEDKERGNPAGSDAGRGLQAIEDAQARAKAHSEEIELARQEAQQEIELQNEATNAWLTGNSLRAAQETEAIAAVTRKFEEGEISKRAELTETAAIQQKFTAEAAMAQQELDERTAKMNDEAAQAGLKGIPLIEAQLRTQINAINAEATKTAGPAGQLTGAQSSDFAQQRVDAETSANQKILESRQEFNERVQSLTAASSDYEAQGYARIEAEERKSLQSLFDDYKSQYGSDQSAWDGYLQAKTQIMANAERQMQQLHQKTMEEITKEEQEAARLGLPEWQKSMLAIEDEYTDRVRQIQQDVNQHVMSEQEGAQAVAAAWAKASAEMQLSEEQARDKIASGLQSMFEHPEQFFEKRAMDTAFQLMANEMLSVFKSSSPAGGILEYLFGMGPQMSTSTDPLTAMGSALGLGGHGGSLATATNPAMVQFQQGSTTLLTGSQALMSAATSLNSAAGMMTARGGMSIGSSPGGGFGIPGFGLGAGTGDGSGGGDMGDFSGTPMIGVPTSMPMSSGTWDNSMMMPGLNGIGSETGGLGGAGATATSNMGAYAGIAGGALMGATSIYSAYTQSNPIAGAVGGAMGGMEAGAALGSIVPGLGTVVGGAIGAIVGGIGGLFAGLFGDKGRGQAEGLDVNTIQPTLAKDMQDYEQGRSGYNQLAAEINSLEISAKNQTFQWGSGARDYYNSNIQPEINVVLSSLQKQERGGRSAVTLSAAQYHTGGWTGDFGDLATSDTEGFIHAMANEFVVNSTAAQQHAPLLSAINAGNVSYSSQVQPRMPASGGGGTVQLTIQAIDSKSVAQWAKGGGGLALMAALNQAQRQYSGVGRG